MNFKTPILLSALTRNTHCHSQCKGLSNIADKGEPKKMFCILFFACLDVDGNGSVRCDKCISAQRRAEKFLINKPLATSVFSKQKDFDVKSPS